MLAPAGRMGGARRAAEMHGAMHGGPGERFAVTFGHETGSGTPPYTRARDGGPPSGDRGGRPRALGGAAPERDRTARRGAPGPRAARDRIARALAGGRRAVGRTSHPGGG